MAVTYFSSPQILLQKSSAIIKPRGKSMVLRHNQIPLKKTPTLQVRSFKNKIFENQSEGIICYRDEQSGEIICEGFDEGPRFHHQLLRTSSSSSSSSSYHSRDAEIIHLLHQRLLQVINGGGESSTNSAADNGVTVQEDFKWNGSNKLC